MIVKKRTKEYRRIYKLWKNMMDRCYNTNHSRYKLYGGNGVIVCERWHTLNNFCEDIDKIQGFNYELFMSGVLCLDKDKKNYNNKIYDIHNCQFITKAENYTLSDADNKGRQGLKNIGTKDGYYITNGKAIPITCTKDSRSSKTIYKDSTGKEIDVNDGNTFIEICPINSNLTIE